MKDALVDPVAVALIGARGIGAFHGESLAHQVPEAELVAIANPTHDAADGLAEATGRDTTYIEEVA